MSISGLIDLDASGAKSWKDPVANASLLPTYGNFDGDTRITLNDQSIYVWKNATSSWIQAATPAIGSAINALIGDVTANGPGSVTATIAANAVTNAKSAQMAAHTYKGNNTASIANAIDLTISQVKTDLSLNNVDNTSDANKPISTATQTALNAKQNSLGFTAVPDTRQVNGHALSSDVTVTKSDVGLSAVPNTDATNPANISQTASYRFTTDTEKSAWNAKQPAGSYEVTTNKSIDGTFSANSNTLYPSQAATKTYVDNSVINGTTKSPFIFAGFDYLGHLYAVPGFTIDATILPTLHFINNTAHAGGSYTVLYIDDSGDSSSVTGLNIVLSGVRDYATGINVDLSGVSTGTQKVGLDISDGVIQVNAFYSTMQLGLPGGSCNINNIANTFTVDPGYPVNDGSYFFGTNMNSIVYIGDDFGVDSTGFGIGFTGNAYVDDLRVDAGKTINDLNSVAAAFVNDDGTGTVTNLNIFYALGLIPEGGGVVATNLVAFHGAAALSLCATNSWGVKIDDTGADNYFAKNVVIGGITGHPTGAFALDVTGDATISGDIAASTITPSNGATGTFTTMDLKTVTVTNGIITSIV